MQEQPVTKSLMNSLDRIQEKEQSLRVTKNKARSILDKLRYPQRPIGEEPDGLAIKANENIIKTPDLVDLFDEASLMIENHINDIKHYLNDIDDIIG